MRKVVDFLVLGTRLSEQERKLLETFTKRLEHLFDLNAAVQNVTVTLADLKTRTDRASVLESIARARTVITSGFQEVLPPELAQDLAVEQKELQELVSVRLHDFSALKTAFLQGSETEKKVNKILDDIKQEIQLEQKTTDELGHLRDSLHTTSLVHAELKSLIRRLLETLTRAERAITPLEVDGLIFELNDLDKQISNTLKKEREQIRHLDGLFVEKYGAEMLLQKYRPKKTGWFSWFSKKKLIDTQDIARDMRAIASADEFMRYNSALLEHAELLTPEAKKYLSTEGAARAEELRKNVVTLTTEAAIDPLTKLYKVNIFNRRFAEEKARSDREGKRICLAFIDIDKFKDFNTIYTHEVANEALVFVCDTIRKTLRKSDVLFRWGGEELLVLLPDTPKLNASIVTEKIRLAVETQSQKLMSKLNTQLEQSLKSRLVWEQRRNMITVSAGVVEYPTEGNDSAALVGAASAKLNSAKQSGRNKIVA